MVENWDQYKGKKYYGHLCACGCGEKIEIKPHHKYDGIPKYINGHARRGKSSSRKGKTWEEIYGKERAKEMKQRGRETHLGKTTSLKEKTWEEILGVEEATKRKQKAKDRFSGDGNPSKQSKVRKKIGKKNSKNMKRLWKDPEYIAMQMKARGVSPNKSEKFLDKLFQKLFPDQWKYTGDGKDKDFIIAGKCPDFVNIAGQKKIIELFGEHVHKLEEEKQRIDLFTQHGYQTLVVWWKELKDLNSLCKKLIEFSGVDS